MSSSGSCLAVDLTGISVEVRTIAKFLKLLVCSEIIRDFDDLHYLYTSAPRRNKIESRS
jgi:hypothetical protein